MILLLDKDSINRYRVDIEKLEKGCNKIALDFGTTEELATSNEIIGQERAAKAIDFGLGVRKKGYNIFVMGHSGTGRNSYVKFITGEKAKNEQKPSDWVYVYNFKTPHMPIALELEPGIGKQFGKEVENIISILKKELESIFLSKDYENERNKLIHDYEEEYDKVVNTINEIAEKYGFKFDRLEDDRVVSIPVRNGRPMNEAQIKRLKQDELDELKENNNQLSLETVELFNKLRILREELQEKLDRLDKSTANKLVKFHIEKIKKKYKSEKVQKYLTSLEEDISDNVGNIKKAMDSGKSNIFEMMQSRIDETFLKRYEVNHFLEDMEGSGAPVVFESNPTYYNLIGSIEYTNEMGVMKTDFTQIKPGAIHMANGGYLILQAKELLSNPFAWQALKRSLLTDEINIESLERQYGYVVTSTLKPQPIPLDLKVIIIGDAYTYYLLYTYDEDFKKLFKVLAEFDVEMSRDPENIEKMSKFIATHCQREDLKHFEKSAVCKIIEYSSRLAEGQKKLSSRFNQIVELIHEADYWAGKSESKFVNEEHVMKALEEKVFRNNLYEEKILEMFEDEDYILDVDGEKIGEINGLAVTGTGEYSFGKPSKITVSTYVGKSGIVNIEREARTSGKIHDKGVMIISGYLGEKYAHDKPLALNANVVFEQLYSGVEGDSASSTELYAILSSISGVPIKQYIAVTGSVNQRGQIQPIGGVNEKIEGFYKVCKLKGLTGKQGVMIPHQNVKNLMLNEEVKAAVNRGEFSIYSVKTIDEGIEILMGMEAEDVHSLVNKKLEDTLKKLKSLNSDSGEKSEK